jgi:hypothetical protein
VFSYAKMPEPRLRLHSKGSGALDPAVAERVALCESSRDQSLGRGAGPTGQESGSINRGSTGDSESTNVTGDLKSRHSRSSVSVREAAVRTFQLLAKRFAAVARAILVIFTLAVTQERCSGRAWRWRRQFFGSQAFRGNLNLSRDFSFVQAECQFPAEQVSERRMLESRPRCLTDIITATIS